jgi:copper(I)-binding protein
MTGSAKQSKVRTESSGLLRRSAPRNDDNIKIESDDKEHAMNKLLRTLAHAALFAALFVAPVRAEEVKAGDLVITQAWSRATPGGAKIGGGYLTIENKGTVADRLIGGSGDVADKIEVHEMAMNNGVMTMRPLDKGLVIEPGKTVKLAPGGYHLMMFDLKSPLKQGDKVPLTLEFEKAGKVKLSLDVQGVGAQGPAGSSGGNMDMQKMPYGMTM